MTHTVRLHNEGSRVRACQLVAEAPDNWECVVRPPQKPDRSAEQNNLQFKWATEVAQQRQDVTIEDVRHEWKLRYGVPILRRDSEQFRETYDKILKPRTYEEKIDAMRIVDVTSTMTVKQMQEYLDTVQRESLQAGFFLTDPDRTSK